MHEDRPDSLDIVMSRFRDEQSEPPAELNDPANYFVSDRLHAADGKVDAAGAFREDRDGRIRMTARNLALGVVMGAVDPVTPEQIAAELAAKGQPDAAAGRDSSAFIPKWTAVSPLPRLAPTAAEPPDLVRRNGKRVRPEWVIQPDNRSPYYPSSYPFSLVGRLFIWDNAAAPNWSRWGTASLLGTRTILTASHCVPWGSRNWKALFVPAFYDGASLFGSWAVSWVSDARGYQRHAQGDDMAVMRLYTPLGSNLGWFGFKTYNSDWEDKDVWTLPGYPWDRDSGNRPWLHANFPIIDDDNDGAGVELEYRADTEGGQSGAPVFAWFRGSPCVVGTHSGGEDNVGEPRQNVAAGGSALTNLLHWARANWP